jgi:hypothetical protein
MTPIRFLGIEVCGSIFNCSTVLGRCAIPLLLALVGTAPAQFAPTLLQNASYWGDGKSEVDFYEAEFVRDAQPRACEVLITFTPGLVDPSTLTPPDDPKQPGAIAVIRMNEVATLPRGLFSEQRSSSALWRTDFMSLAQMSFAGTDGIGNVSKSVYENRSASKVTWNYSCDTWRGKIDRREISCLDGSTVFYDELPLRVRMLDFSKATGEFDAQLLPTLTAAQKELGEIKPAKFSWKIGDRSIAVSVQHAAGMDRFVLDRDFPFLLREWTAADGSHLKLKNSLKVDYRNYGKNGDRERALKDPMLRHPD